MGISTQSSRFNRFFAYNICWRASSALLAFAALGKPCWLFAEDKQDGHEGKGGRRKVGPSTKTKLAQSWRLWWWPPLLLLYCQFIEAIFASSMARKGPSRREGGGRPVKKVFFSPPSMLLSSFLTTLIYLQLTDYCLAKVKLANYITPP